MYTIYIFLLAYQNSLVFQRFRNIVSLIKSIHFHEKIFLKKKKKIFSMQLYVLKLVNYQRFDTFSDTFYSCSPQKTLSLLEREFFILQRCKANYATFRRISLRQTRSLSIDAKRNFYFYLVTPLKNTNEANCKSEFSAAAA